jgi:hypothetical protein
MGLGIVPAEWPSKPPAAFDIVACFFPESEPKPDGSIKLRPALVLSVLRRASTGEVAVRVAYGTKNLKLMHREHLDLIIQNASDMRLMGLAVATRFDLDHVALLPWTDTFFGCWSGYQTPVIGSLTQEYAKELAWLMLKREQPET